MAEYINRKAAINEAEKYGLSDGSVIGRHSGIADCIASEISKIPAADVAPVRRGEWEETDWVEPDWNGFGTVRIQNGGLRCSRCANVFRKELLWKENYCPNCGAKMEETK